MRDVLPPSRPNGWTDPSRGYDDNELPPRPRPEGERDPSDPSAQDEPQQRDDQPDVRPDVEPPAEQVS